MWIEPKHNNWQDNEAKGVGATTKTMELLHFRLRCIHFTQGLKVLIAAKNLFWLYAYSFTGCCKLVWTFLKQYADRCSFGL